jgi:hypothetical protein
MRRRQVSTVASASGARRVPEPERRQFLSDLALVILLGSQILVSDAFAPSRGCSQYHMKYSGEPTTHRAILGRSQPSSSSSSSSSLWASRTAAAPDDDDVYTVQILMSDTGGGHRASANALRDAFDVLYPNTFECDIVDIYTEYGPFWPYNDYVAMYRLMSKYSWMWDLFYRFGETDVGLWLNEFLLTTFCYQPFKECMEGRVFDSTKRRADMVISVHPLCQDVPLKILSELDGNDARAITGTTSKTPFVTVVTDLGGAHKAWFNPGYVQNMYYERRKKECKLLSQYQFSLRDFQCIFLASLYMPVNHVVLTSALFRPTY